MKVKERGYAVTVTCIMCNTEHTLLVNREDWDVYNRPCRPHIQDIFPYLSPDERELLISGTCNKCWNEIFSSPDDEDDGDYNDDDEEDCYCE